MPRFECDAIAFILLTSTANIFLFHWPLYRFAISSLSEVGWHGLLALLTLVVLIGWPALGKFLLVPLALYGVIVVVHALALAGRGKFLHAKVRSCQRQVGNVHASGQQDEDRSAP